MLSALGVRAAKAGCKPALRCRRCEICGLVGSDFIMKSPDRNEVRAGARRLLLFLQQAMRNLLTGCGRSSGKRMPRSKTPRGLSHPS